MLRQVCMQQIMSCCVCLIKEWFQNRCSCCFDNFNSHSLYYVLTIASCTLSTEIQNNIFSTLLFLATVQNRDEN
jgi:hypothetical protein